ncbi:MAG: hypothetical protein A2776_01435 [Candidatus Levybacteria bacterium RIFCSPHIGHO2_01_FULL_40_10]|nr:MAG: hypothetical protein A2776_01435 [Candidatus Levybacteria bacterium RIFCSPHIGHO2_01_FULL_40_10]
MDKILNIQNLQPIKQKKSNGYKIVLVGGCFDILHAAHIEFLRKAKDIGDILVVLLESDEKVKKLKGKTRPINSQADRATILVNLPTVDYVICLPYFKIDKDYETLVKMIEPDIIAITSNEKVYRWEREYVKGTGGSILEVMKRRVNFSTTRLTKEMKI